MVELELGGEGPGILAMVRKITKVAVGDGVLDLRSILWIGVPALGLIVALGTYIYLDNLAVQATVNVKDSKDIENLQIGVNALITNVSVQGTKIDEIIKSADKDREWLRREFDGLKAGHQ
jgi:hypothetical protein